MSAFNWIIVAARCPVCRKEVDLRCQTHVASSYDGDQTGRFHNREYRLGDQMTWWPRDHGEFQTWRVNGRWENLQQGQTDSECCYTSCPKCGADLFAVIDFDGPCPIALKSVGVEENWPKDYKK